MKKISAFFIAIVLFVIIVLGYNAYLDKKIEQNKDKLYYLLADEKFNSLEAAKVCLDDNSILVLGSSELGTFKQKLFNNAKLNFNMYLVGTGHTQCLQSALTLGAIEKETNIKKVVLILSPQWFQSSANLNSKIFASRFQKDTFNTFLKNNKISLETKQKIIDRLKVLEVDDVSEYKKMNIYEEAYLHHNIFDRFYLNLIDNIANTKQKIKLIECLENINGVDMLNIRNEDTVYTFEELLVEATREGENACTNNEFGVYNEYYDTYMRPTIENSKNISNGVDFSNSTEYEDLETFLKVCNELGIQPLLINVPVNGRWYDYIGIPQEKRAEYYEKINNLAIKYNAKLADFSECEYEKYFLQDIMHLGWRGWVKVDEEIYKYYKE